MSLREPITLAATMAGRQAALFHGVVEKNIGSRDVRKREFAAEAASALSFWALRLRPIHRSAEVASDEPGSPATASETTRPVDMTSLFLPVTMVKGDLEFQQLMQEYEVVTLPNPQTSSAGLPLSMPAVSLSTCVPAAPTTATVDLQPSAAVQVMMMLQCGTAVELDGPPMSIHAPSDGGLEQPGERQPSGQSVDKMTDNRPVEPLPRARAAAKPASGGRRHGPSSSSKRQRASRNRSPSATSSRPSRDGEPDRRPGRITLSLDEYRELMRARRPWR